MRSCLEIFYRSLNIVTRWFRKQNVLRSAEEKSSVTKGKCTVARRALHRLSLSANNVNQLKAVGHPESVTPTDSLKIEETEVYSLNKISRAVTLEWACSKDLKQRARKVSRVRKDDLGTSGTIRRQKQKRTFGQRVKDTALKQRSTESKSTFRLYADPQFPCQSELEVAFIMISLSQSS